MASPLQSSTQQVVFVRHGESQWNQDNLFCGWVDVDLSDLGLQEAHVAAASLVDARLHFDVVFTSVLQRAVRTAEIIVDRLSASAAQPRLIRHWQLNERHYGALTGKNKAQMVAEFGKEMVQVWRRSYDVRPPPITPDHACFGAIENNPIFADVPRPLFPRHESLKDLVERTVPYWQQVIVPELAAGRRVLVVAHGTSLRGLVKHLMRLDKDQISQLNLPNGIPFVMKLDGEDGDYRCETGLTFMADDETVRKATEKVANIQIK